MYKNTLYISIFSRLLDHNSLINILCGQLMHMCICVWIYNTKFATVHNVCQYFLFCFIEKYTLGVCQCIHLDSILCNPMDCSSPQAPLSMEFSRQEYWSGLPFPTPGDLPNPQIKPVSLGVSCIGRPLCHLGSH